MDKMAGSSQLNPIFENVRLGVGTWAWGDRLFWGYGRGYQEADLRKAFDSTLSSGIRFFDTAEVYGQGKSEDLLGKFIRDSGQEVIVATKFMPFPWRLSRRSLVRALKKSIHRLGLEKVSLYQIHSPLPPITIETWMDALSEAVQNGLTSAVGVSNFDMDQMMRSYDSLVHRGIRLSSNQVEYNLLNRSIEFSGMLERCCELGVVLIAYSPLALGLLSGKYTPENPPQGIRGSRINKKYLNQIQPLIKLLRKIGADHEGKTPSQVAINWVICKGALPIPGAKNELQAEQNSGALGWTLSESEIAQLDDASFQISKKG